MKITKAVIIGAGLGTRFLPFSKCIPKEMLPIVDKPVIQYVVEDMVKSGIKIIILVTSHSKKSLEDHFFTNFELEWRLKKNNKTEQLREIQKLSKIAKFIFVRQEQALGNGHALLQAEEAVGNEPFLFSDADNIIDSKIPIAKQLVDVYEKYGKEVMGTLMVAKKDVVKYGIARPGKRLDSRTRELLEVIEKPTIKEAPSTWASQGMKYVFRPTIFEYIKKTKSGIGGEIWLVDAFNASLKDHPSVVYNYDGKYYDCGNKFDVLRANIEFGIKHPEVGKIFKKYLQSLIKKS